MNILFSTVISILLSATIGLCQDWECQDCPKRDIGLYDLDVWVENPSESDASPMGQKLYQDWVELFNVAGGIHYALFEDDPSKECINYYDGQMATLSSFEEQNYEHGNNQTSLPPPAGTIDEVDYWITGIIANQESDGLTIIKVYVQASGTGETVTEAVDVFDGTISGFEAGKKVAEQLMPLMGKIRNFEKRKRDQVDIVAIDPDGKGAIMELKPQRDVIKIHEKVSTTVKLIDCDGVPLKNIKVRLTSQGGYFNPKEVVTDRRGIAIATFTAGAIPGKFGQQFEFDFQPPFTFELNTSGDEGFVTIESMQYDASIRIRKTYDKELKTSHADQSENDGCITTSNADRSVNESIEATATLTLKLENVQEMPIFYQTWEYYKPMSVSLTGFNYSYIESQNSTSKTSGAGCSQVSHSTNVDISRQAKDYEITEEALATQTYWILVLDSKTGHGLKLLPAGYGIDFDIQETHSVRSVITSEDGPTYDHSSTSTERSRSFELGPVAEEEADPTIKSSETWIQDFLKNQGVELPAGIEIPTPSNESTIKKIHPDILVKQGDGISTLGGDGDRLIEKELEHGKQEERLHYSWSMRRRPNNQ